MRRLKAKLALICVCSLLLPFYQSCDSIRFNSVNHDSSDRKSNTIGGGGIDGKIYASRGDCAGKAEIHSLLDLTDPARPALIREQCLDLPKPRHLDGAAVHRFPQNRDIVQIGDLLFDRITPSNQRVTIWACASIDPGVEVHLWTINFGSWRGQLYRPGDGPSPVLTLDPPDPAAPNVFESVTGQAWRFRLEGTGQKSAVLEFSDSSSPLRRVEMACARPQPALSLGAYLDDSGLATTGVPQNPGLLARYLLRPPWSVPGVDFPVGAPAGQVLKNPGLLNLAGVTVDPVRRVLQLNGDGLSLDGFDFSAGGGWSVTVNGRNTRIVNSVFRATSTQADAPIIASGTSRNLYLANLTLDGGGLASTFAHNAMVVFLGQGLTVSHCWFSRSGGGMIDTEWGGGLSAGGDAVIEHSVFEHSTTFSNSVSYLSLGYGNFSRVAFNFNLTYESANDNVATVKAYELGPIRRLEIGNNTMIAAAGASPAYLMQIDGKDPISAGLVHDNYFDLTSAYGFTYPGIASPQISYRDNFDMATGRRLTDRP